jgi:hypothetical protein
MWTLKKEKEWIKFVVSKCDRNVSQVTWNTRNVLERFRPLTPIKERGMRQGRGREEFA